MTPLQRLAANIDRILADERIAPYFRPRAEDLRQYAEANFHASPYLLE